MITKSDFLRNLESMIALDAGTLTGTEALADVPNWDSLALMSFIAFVDSDFGMRLGGRQLMECGTVDDLMKLVGDNVQR
jgi:acyl carrier protein